MKILWFTNTPSLFKKASHNYNGGGWIESLEELVRERKELQLGISFFYSQNIESSFQDGVKYYPIYREKSRNKPFLSIFENYRAELIDNKFINTFLDVINDFKPDIIQVFGTENSFGLIQNYTKVPVVIHLQGLINPCLNSFFPASYSKLDMIFNLNFGFKNLIGTSPIFNYFRFKKQAFREKEILRKAKFVFGRTVWDKQVVELYNPHVKYFHINEVLRSNFYLENSTKREVKSKEIFTIVSTISPTVYKGIDLILKTAKLFKEQTNIEFQWKVIGLEPDSDLLNFFKNKEQISPLNFNIKFLGILNSEQLIEQLNSADVFVHPSYIDNSPNSVCEAQMLGLPVIACNVGGVSCLIENEINGLLIPANGVFELASSLKNLYHDLKQRIKFSNNSKLIARKRHDKKVIIDNLILGYMTILN